MEQILIQLIDLIVLIMVKMIPNHHIILLPQEMILVKLEFYDILPSKNHQKQFLVVAIPHMSLVSNGQMMILELYPLVEKINV